MKISIALAQFLSTDDPDENLHLTRAILQKAKAKKIDLVLFPELWTIAYSDLPEEAKEAELWRMNAILDGDDRYQTFQHLAKEFGAAFTFNFLETNEDHSEFYNASHLFDAEGRVILRYRKTHLVDKAWERTLVAGDTFDVGCLKTGSGELNVGTMICYDREFPEVARLLMLKGAELILVPNACMLENNRLAQFQARGFENMLAVAMTNYPAPKNNGFSVAYDGMRKKGEDHDPTLILMDEKEGLGIIELDLDVLRAYREKEIWGDAYRRPDLYRDLIKDDPKFPFVRKDARRNKND